MKPFQTRTRSWQSVRFSLRPFAALSVVGMFLAQPAAAETFKFGLGGETIEGVSNTTVVTGVAIRVEDRDADLIGKGHLNPDVCGRPDGALYYQSCQGLFRTQTFPAERIVSAKGFGSSNFDQGNLNYEQGDITQSGLKLAQDVTLTWGDFGFFAKGFAFYDPVNAHFREYFPTVVTRDNYQDVGYVSTPGTELIRAGNVPQALSLLAPLVSSLNLPANAVTQLLSNPLAIPVLGVRNDSSPCPASRNPSGGPCGLVYGAGGVEYRKRKNNNTLKEIGRGLILQDLNFFGNFDIPGDRQLAFRVGRQQIQWGEATIEFFDSLNIFNPPDLNNLFRMGGNGLDDFYQPLNAISLSTSLFEGASISGFYQLEWQPLQAPAAGGFFSPINANTHNGGFDYFTVAYGQFAQDPDGVGVLLDSPLTAITNTTSAIPRLKDRKPGWGGQFGLQFKYYADWLNNGTDFGVYFANYHSRLPIVSFYATDRGCGKDATDTVSYLAACPDIPLLHALKQPNDPAGATDDDLALDSARVFVEYPKNIQMYGLSFNTTVGTVALQGELAYRPHDPMQVALLDLAYASFGPTLHNCDRGGCPLGSPAPVGLGVMPDGSIGAYTQGSAFVTDANGTPGAFNDVLFAGVGFVPSAARAFPNFIIPYRGGTIGQNPANGYIRGWEDFHSLSTDLGATYVEGTTDFGPKLIKADQIIWIFEVGSRWVPDLPSLDRLQLEAPGIQYNASAGADGSGADGSRQACSTNPACSYGADGLRFNPHQQNLKYFPDKFSGGYALIALIRYESVFPGISLQPQIIFKHDVYHTSPGLASNYVEGRILWDTALEVRYKSNLSFNFGYRLFAGGGVANQLQDRDEARFYVKYAF